MGGTDRIWGKERERDRRGETAGKQPQGLGGGTICKGKHESPATAGCRVQTATEREQKCRCRSADFWGQLNHEKGDVRPSQEQQTTRRLGSNKEML